METFVQSMLVVLVWIAVTDLRQKHGSLRVGMIVIAIKLAKRLKSLGLMVELTLTYGILVGYKLTELIFKGPPSVRAHIEAARSVQRHQRRTTNTGSRAVDRGTSMGRQDQGVQMQDPDFPI